MHFFPTGCAGAVARLKLEARGVSHQEKQVSQNLRRLHRMLLVTSRTFPPTYHACEDGCARFVIDQLELLVVIHRSDQPPHCESRQIVLHVNGTATWTVSKFKVAVPGTTVPVPLMNVIRAPELTATQWASHVEHNAARWWANSPLPWTYIIFCMTKNNTTRFQVALATPYDTALTNAMLMLCLLEEANAGRHKAQL